MKFIAIRSNIKEAISVIEKSAGENTNLPILKNILIEAENNIITFTSTNLETAISHHVAGKIIEGGKITAPLSLLASLIGNIQSDRLNFEKKGNNLEVTTDNYSAIINGMPAEDFPITPKIKTPENYIEIKSVFIREAIQQTTVAAQFSDLRPELSSIFFNFSLENIKIAATDGFRLTEKTIPSNAFTTKKMDEFKVLIPLRTAYEIARIVKDEDMMRISIDENQIFFKTEKTELISRLIEGNFPEYGAIVPHEFAGEVVVNREDVANAVKLAGVFGQRNSEVKIKIHQNKKAIEISSADQALGENTYLLPAKIKGEALETFFNWRYLSDPMKTIKEQDVFLGLQAEANPALIRGTSDTSYFYVLKPILKS